MNEERHQTSVSIKAQIQTKKVSYTYDNPHAIAFADAQEDVFWTAREISVDKDIQDMRVNMTEAEYHGVTTTLKLFTLYELVAGRDYWLGRVMRMFPRPDIELMAATFGFVELKIHAPFYNNINEALMLNTDEFYMSYIDDPLLKERMDFIESMVCHKEDLVSLGTFSVVEGGILYSAFAFLKHFQAKGKNKLRNVVRGINFSVRDENLHSEGGAWLYNLLVKQRKELGLLEDNNLQNVEYSITKAVKTICEHEFRIVDMIFEKGDMEGICKDDLKKFIMSRMNICLSQLGIAPAFENTESTIETWFYEGINSVQLNDQFSGVGSAYNRNWIQENFKWQP